MSDSEAYLESLLDLMVSEDLADLFLHENDYPRVRRSGRVEPLDAALVDGDFFVVLAQRAASPDWAGGTLDKSIASSSGHRFRLNLFTHLGVPAAVIRKLNTDIPSLDDLGLPSAMLHEWINRASGMILVAGPPGSGKSTTSASMLEWINLNHQKHIVCIEDPVEFLHTNQHSFFTHREVGADIAGFAKGMEEALRQSPDIIFLGEIRDRDTARATLHAAETGHLVLATIHGSSATEGLERFVQIFDQSERDALRLILSGALVGILFQRLLTGTDGKILPALEFFENAGLVRRLIREGRNDELRDLVNGPPQASQCSFLWSLVELVRAGRLDEETARRHLANPQDFQRAMKGIR